MVQRLLCYLGWMFLASPVVLAGSTDCGIDPSPGDCQPKTLLTIESRPSRRVMGSLSMPQGSPWCNGMPTYWLVGHQSLDESPWCLRPQSDIGEDTDFSDYYDLSTAEFVPAPNTVLDVNDALNMQDDDRIAVDRHDCVHLDANADGLEDIVCGVGANKAKGFGYNELYLTNDDPLSNNRVEKILAGQGLHKYPTMRNRLTTTLTGADGSTLILMATLGSRRDDGAPNNHRMFNLTMSDEPIDGLNFYFEEAKGIVWRRYSNAKCLRIADVNNDGLDDIVMCNSKRPFIFTQNADGTFNNVKTPGAYGQDWSNARIVDVTGDGIADLVAVTGKRQSKLYIFEGKEEEPYFILKKKPWFQVELPYYANDLEIVDVNNDGIPDIYVVQYDNGRDEANYCATHQYFKHRNWYDGGPYPPASFVPPNDIAADVLLVGEALPDDTRTFKYLNMTHSEPGCGAFLELFGNNRTLIVGQGYTGRAGHNLLLQW